MPRIITKACNKCSACIAECPTGSIIEGKNQYYIDADTCADHLACVNVCPVNAIQALPDKAADLKAKFEEEEEEEEES